MLAETIFPVLKSEARHENRREQPGVQVVQEKDILSTKLKQSARKWRTEGYERVMWKAEQPMQEAS